MFFTFGFGLNTPSANTELQLSSGGTFSFATLPKTAHPLAAKSEVADTFTHQTVQGFTNQSPGESSVATLTSVGAPVYVQETRVHLGQSQHTLRTHPEREKDQMQVDQNYVYANGTRQYVAPLNTSALGLHMMMIKAAASSLSSADSFIQLHTAFITANMIVIGMCGGLIFLAAVLLVWYWVYSTMLPQNKTARVAMNKIVSPHSHHVAANIFQYTIAVTVIFNVSMVIFESNPQITSQIQLLFHVFEAVSSWMFMVEYFMRLYAIPESKIYAHICDGDCAIRLAWITSFDSVVDLIAIFPYFFEVFSSLLQGKPKPEKNHTLTWLRILRLNRLCRIGAVKESVDVFARVVYYNSEILVVALILCVLLVLILSIILYYLAPPDSIASEDDFSSVTACMYLSLMMLTGQGQPDGKLPWYTKVIVCITCFFAVGVFAIQASMLTWGFECEAGRRAMRARGKRKEKVQQVLAGHEPESHSSDSGDFDDEWDDYDQVLAGSDVSDAEPDEPVETGRRSDVMKLIDGFTLKQLKCVTKIFKYIDCSHDGTLARAELDCLPSLNVDMIFAGFDKDQSNSITSEEFLKWIVSIQKKQPRPVFSMVLTNLLKECKAESKKREEGDAHEQRAEDIDAFVENVRCLKEDNERLRNQIQQLRKEQAGKPEQCEQEQGKAKKAGKRHSRRKDFQNACTDKDGKKLQCVNQIMAHL